MIQGQATIIAEDTSLSDLYIAPYIHVLMYSSEYNKNEQRENDSDRLMKLELMMKELHEKVDFQIVTRTLLTEISGGKWLPKN